MLEVEVELVLVLAPAVPAVVVVVVLESCASTVARLRAPATPAASNLVNVFRFIFNFCFLMKDDSFVFASDRSRLSFIQLL